MMGLCHHELRHDECCYCSATPAQKAEYQRERARREPGSKRLAEARAAKLAGYAGRREPKMTNSPTPLSDDAVALREKIAAWAFELEGLSWDLNCGRIDDLAEEMRQTVKAQRLQAIEGEG